jgi:hypothetical protein
MSPTRSSYTSKSSTSRATRVLVSFSGHCTRTGCAEPRRLVHAIRARTCAQIETTQIIRPGATQNAAGRRGGRTRNRELSDLRRTSSSGVARQISAIRTRQVRTEPCPITLAVPTGRAIPEVPFREAAEGVAGRQHPRMGRVAAIPSACTSSSPAGRRWHAPVTRIHVFVHPSVRLPVLPTPAGPAVTPLGRCVVGSAGARCIDHQSEQP